MCPAPQIIFLLGRGLLTKRGDHSHICRVQSPRAAAVNSGRKNHSTEAERKHKSKGRNHEIQKIINSKYLYFLLLSGGGAC